MMSQQNIIGFIHLGAMVAFSAYGFIDPWVTATEFLDRAYIATISSTILSWIILRDECLISYYVKKRANPAYILGTNPESEDMSDLFPHVWQYKVIVFASHLSKMASLYVVVLRREYLIQQYPMVFYCTLYGVMVGYMVGYGFEIQETRRALWFRAGMGLSASWILLSLLNPLFYLSLVFGLGTILIFSWCD
jgi:hypothetical protein